MAPLTEESSENPTTSTAHGLQKQTQERASAGGFVHPSGFEPGGAYSPTSALRTHDGALDVGAPEVADQYSHAEPQPRPDTSVELDPLVHRQLTDYCKSYRMDPRSFLSGLALSELRGGSNYASGMTDGIRAGGVVALLELLENIEREIEELHRRTGSRSLNSNEMGELAALERWSARIRAAVKS